MVGCRACQAHPVAAHSAEARSCCSRAPSPSRCSAPRAARRRSPPRSPRLPRLAPPLRSPTRRCPRGLALTTDGGASFHPVAGHDREDPLFAVTCTEGALRVHRYGDDFNRTHDPLIATIDVGSKRLSLFV